MERTKKRGKERKRSTVLLDTAYVMNNLAQGKGQMRSPMRSSYVVVFWEFGRRTNALFPSNAVVVVRSKKMESRINALFPPPLLIQYSSSRLRLQLPNAVCTF